MEPSPFSVVRYAHNPKHSRATVFNRHAHSGELTVLSNDYQTLKTRLGGGDPRGKLLRLFVRLVDPRAVVYAETLHRGPGKQTTYRYIRVKYFSTANTWHQTYWFAKKLFGDHAVRLIWTYTRMVNVSVHFASEEWPT